MVHIYIDIYILLIQRETTKNRQGEQVDLEGKKRRVQGLEEKERQRRPGGVLKEEDKERKKKELSLKTVYSSQSKYYEK